MTFKNVYYDTKRNKIHLWEQINGENFYDNIYWTPYAFIPCHDGEIETIEGKKVAKKTFESNKDYYNFCKKNKESEIYENEVVPTIQFLAERYHKIPTDEMKAPDLKTYSVDIEVHSESGMFPSIENPEDPIVLISVTNIKTGEVFCFGEKEITKKFNYNYKYFNCGSEEKLLKQFLSWWHKNPPDVITGWNVTADYKVNVTGGFDLPYIINRCKNLFEKKIYKLLSPINIIDIRYKEETKSYVVDIAGISVIDYMALYKWYTSNNLESHSLETVCQHELGKGKLEYENDLKWLYYNDWNTYVEYNIEDTFLIKELEDKLKYIKLAQSLSLLCKCPLKSYSSTTKLIEGLMLTRFRRNNKCAPHFKGGSKPYYPAAHVIEPQKNKYNWVISFDITSSYPFAIITCNMSLETLYGKILNLHEDDIIEYTRNSNFPQIQINKNGRNVKLKGKDLEKFNKAIEKKLFSVAPNGSLFINGKRGVYAEMESDVFLKRKKIKKLMSDKFKEYEKTKDPNIKQEAENLNTYQLALKVVINGAYGVTAVPYSRYFNPHIAEAITAVGRCSLKSGKIFINEIMNDFGDDIKTVLNEIG
ncbi:MAG: 3'-5' exonuclease [bacterium]